MLRPSRSKPVALLNLRHNVPERFQAFTEGLERIGFRCHIGIERAFTPGPQDIFVSWNRIHEADAIARRFQAIGGAVLITENASWGNDFAGRRWYTLARDYHNLAGKYPIGGPERFDALGVELAPYRQPSDQYHETVLLPSRGIGPPAIRMPLDWERRARKQTGGRIRKHPGTLPAISLEEDLRSAIEVITWGSGAAIKASALGVRVFHALKGWIGAHDNTEHDRLAMFRDLAWAQWTLEEIASGEPFVRLLEWRQ